jgi:hypothetical protein
MRSFDKEWYQALKSAFSRITLSRSETQALQLILNYPDTPVYELPTKIGKRAGSAIQLLVGNHIVKRKLWKILPTGIRKAQQPFIGQGGYCGVLCTFYWLEGDPRCCFELRPEAKEALLHLNLISRRTHRRSDELPDDAHIPKSLPAETKRELRLIRQRRGQTRFREDLMQAYGGRCAVTGCADRAVLEAAHIAPFSKRGRYDVTNGLLLRTDWHTLFDLGLWAVDPQTGQVRVSPELSDPMYIGANGRRLRKPTKLQYAPRSTALRRRYRDFCGL